MPQKFIQIIFPSEESDWNENLYQAQKHFIALIQCIAVYQKVLVVIAEKNPNHQITNALTHKNIARVYAPSNDTWARDISPLAVKIGNNYCLYKFQFNGWGKKYEYEKDNNLFFKIQNHQWFANYHIKEMDFVLEGGAIDTNGDTTILTSPCIFLKNRNPHLSQKELEKRIKKIFNVKQIICLKNGFLHNDDTDGHIDNLARFTDKKTIVYNYTEDKEDIHFEKFKENEAHLKQISKHTFTLIPIPLPDTIYNKKGEALPASYLNFLILNKIVLIPNFCQEKDEKIMYIFKKIFRNRKVIGIDCRYFIEQKGGLHCLTMQYPQ